MDGELIEPNWHIALVHFPIALLIIGTLIEALCFLGWRRSTFRLAGRWMILLGAVSGVPVSASGIYALFDVLPGWAGAEHAMEELREHVLFAALGTLGALAVCTIWIGLSDRGRDMAYWPLLAVLLLSAGLIGSAAHHGGIIVYEHGVGVRERETPSGQNEPTTPATAPKGVSSLAARVAVWAPPLQTHIFIGGAAMSLSLLTIGLSSRVMIERMALARDRAPRSDAKAIADAIENPPAEPERVLRLTTRCAPVAVSACLLGLLAATVGLWFLAYDADAWSAEALRQQILDDSMNPGGITSRRAAHVVGGMAIIVLPLALLATSRWLPRLRLVWVAVSVLLVFVVASQVWLGVLMMFDETRVLGPITGWSK